MTKIEMHEKEKILRNNYESDGKYGIPKIHKEMIDITQLDIMAFDHVSSKQHGDEGKTIHFFLNDFKFEKVYNYPEKYIMKLARYRYLFSPDFSVYADMPLALQMHSVFKNRWCGAYWQEFGLHVIPTISWGEDNSFSFCFDGVERNSVVAVSTVGVKREKKKFLRGYDAMLEQLEPSAILCYDKPFVEMRGKIIYINYLQATGRCP